MRKDIISMYNFVHPYIPLSVHFYFIINIKMWIFTLIGILTVLLLLVTFLPVLAPLLAWILGIVIFIAMIVLAAVFFAFLIPFIAIGFLVWIIYSAIKTWKR